MTARPRIYNPREASPDVLEAMLVGRKPIIDEVLADLARQAGAETRQHWLIRGPRGIGKTHLIGIVYHRVLRDPGLQGYLPIWLGEAEAYSVYSAAVLLLQIAEQLVSELHQAGDPDHIDLRARLSELEHAGDDPALFEEIVQLLRDEARKRGKILLVLMENLDAALAGLPGRKGTGQIQRLRSLLSQDREFLFLSTTPTRYLAAVADPRQPLYGQLKERTLQPLLEQEVGELLAQLAQVTGQQDLASFEGDEPEFSVRRRVLHRLTGGNPRAVVMAFSVLTGNPGVQAIVDEMTALLDAQTAYFESRLSQLAPRERSVVAAMALAPENLTLLEIARLSRLPLRPLSTQVKRLEEQGYVLPTAGEGGKGTIYELSDGLFRLWYQFRKGSKILGPIVHFLALWHPLDALERSLAELLSTSEEPSLLQRDLVRLTLHQIDAALELARSEAGRRSREELWGGCSKDLQALSSENYEPTPGNFEKLKVALISLSGEPSQRALTEWLCFTAIHLSRFTEAEEFARRFLELSPSLEDQALASALQSFVGRSLEKQDRPAEAPTWYNGFARDFGDKFSDPLSYACLRLLDHFYDDSKLRAFYVLRILRRPELKILPGELLSEIALFLLGIILDTDAADLRLQEWANHVAEDNVWGVPLKELLLQLGKLRSAVPLGRVLPKLAASQNREVAETAKLFRLVSNVVAADLGGKPGQARRSLARVPPELRQTVSEYAEQIVAARRKGEASKQAGSPVSHAEGV